MNNVPPELARRIEELEIRLSFQDEQLRQLDAVIQAQALKIDQLNQDLGTLREQMVNPQGEEAPPEEQVPPHY